ncbi:hypothetical protein HFO87_09260 [Rhizobium leguminosarum]|uniref:hypothetical protein n=1 Tax=Rhizobium leguminosarum TaxID=384 RepID=UPI001C9428DB|nr:hypothetical protein [Rhizobium leguminosarum]MBY5484659.1 hypothetical protein [Rhizobium leguminosarum]
MSDPRYKWWEKTVEYLYLTRQIEKGFKLVIPFAGPFERSTGDALVVEGDQFEIVEFKHDSTRSCLSTEDGKFGNGDFPFEDYLDVILTTKHQLAVTFGALPHWFVCGASMEGKFALEQFPYWVSDEYETGPLEEDEFYNYLTCLAAVRAESQQGQVSGGLVLGINTSDRTISAQPLDELVWAIQNGIRFQIGKRLSTARTI